MIKQIKIKKLFNKFDYDINFFETGITILTGPNGFGKSTILKIIESIEDKDLYELSKFPFLQFYLLLSNDLFLDLRKEDGCLIVNGIKLKIPDRRRIENFEKRRIEPAYIVRLGPHEYLDLRDNTYLTFEEAHKLRMNFIHDVDFTEDRLIAANCNKAKENKNFIKLENILSEFRKELGPIKFIKEQRLLRREIDEDGSRYLSHKREIAVEVINEIPNKIKEEIKNVVLKYSQVSSSLDRTFTERLFNTGEGISREDYSNSLNVLMGKFDKIKNYKLLSDSGLSSTEYKETFSQALKVYLEDTKEKVEVFDDLINRLELFTNIINSKLNFKKIVISNEDGLKILSDDDFELEASKLSSGEQQIIVLYYDLIFGVKDKLTLLIDEPEISLHVAWQRELLKDFKKIIEMQSENLNLIVATHSPQVIDNNWNFVVDLGLLYGGQ